MKTKLISITIVVALFFSSCDLLQSLENGYNMVNCTYNYHSLSNITISGINVSEDLTLSKIARLSLALTNINKSLPVSFDVNMKVTNPNTTTAGFQKMDYIIDLDSIEFATGNMSNAFSVDGGKTATMTLPVETNITTLLQKHSTSTLINVLKNFAGLGTKSTLVTVKLKPTFKVGNGSFTSPAYIPVKFSYGGKKSS